MHAGRTQKGTVILSYFHLAKSHTTAKKLFSYFSRRSFIFLEIAATTRTNEQERMMQQTTIKQVLVFLMNRHYCIIINVTNNILSLIFLQRHQMQLAAVLMT